MNISILLLFIVASALALTCSRPICAEYKNDRCLHFEDQQIACASYVNIVAKLKNAASMEKVIAKGKKAMEYMLKNKDTIRKYVSSNKIAAKLSSKVKGIPIVGGIIQTESNVSQLLKSGGAKFQKWANKVNKLSAKAKKFANSKQGKKVIQVAKKVAQNKHVKKLVGTVAKKVPGVAGAIDTVSAVSKLAKKGGYKDAKNWQKLATGVIKTAPQTAGIAKAVNVVQKANKYIKLVKQ